MMNPGGPEVKHLGQTRCIGAAPACRSGAAPGSWSDGSGAVAVGVEGVDQPLTADSDHAHGDLALVDHRDLRVGAVGGPLVDEDEDVDLVGAGAYDAGGDVLRPDDRRGPRRVLADHREQLAVLRL